MTYEAETENLDYDQDERFADIEALVAALEEKLRRREQRHE